MTDPRDEREADSDWEWPGARWWKCDLHTHTPGSDFREDVSPEQWVQAALDTGLDAVAVTDHNTASWVERITAAARDTSLTVFPGVELTVSSGTHLLVLFDSGTEALPIERYLGLCGQPDPGDRESPAQCSFVEALAKTAPFDVVTVAAHIVTEKGIVHEHDFSTPLQKILSHPRLDAVEINRWPPDDPPEDRDKLLRALRGDLPAYARDRGPLAILRSSDAHKLDQIGSGTTWIKMTRPSLEGLRLALQDGQPLSIRNEWAGDTEDPNRHAELVIERLVLNDLQYMGRGEPLKVRLNPWLNAIIGGRGSGKSTLVECLRLALRRWDELPASLQDELVHYQEIPKGRGGRGLLTDETEILVYYRKGAARFRIRWRPDGEGPSIEKQTEGGTWQEAPGQVQERFPVRLYSQKQIFELSRDPSALLKIIDEAPEVEHRTWSQERDRLENRYLSLQAQARELEGRLARRESLRGELDDLRRKLEVFEGGGHAELLQDYQRHRRQTRTIDRWLADIEAQGNRLRSTVEELTTEPPPRDPWPEAPATTELFEIIANTDSTLATLRDEAIRLAARADRAAAEARAQIARSAWATAKAKVDTQYEALQERLAAEGVDDPTAYGHFVQRRHLVEEELRALDELKDRIRKLRDEASATSDELYAHRREISRRRAEFLAMTLPEQSLVRTRVVPCGHRGGVEEELRGLIDKPGTTFEKDLGSTDSGDGLLGKLYRDYPPDPQEAQTSEELFDTFGTCLRELKEKLLGLARGDHHPVRDNRFAQHLQSLPPERLDRLMLWFPEDALEVSYSSTGDGRHFKPLSQASPGQKTAALLAFLLSYGEEPIVLDQPEDDLDNHLIYDLVVQRLREIKTTRQVVVVTHNPNIVVHGDAELVIPLDVRGGQTYIVHSGGLQEQEVRDEVCRIMEGGREALRRRYQRIGLGPGDPAEAN